MARNYKVDLPKISIPRYHRPAEKLKIGPKIRFYNKISSAKKSFFEKSNQFDFNVYKLRV